MSDISTSYMGLPLKSPVIVGASPISKKIDNIKKAEEAGAGALVIYSLFQEQIESEIDDLEAALLTGSYLYSEALTYFPILEHAGAREHVMWVEKTRKQVSMPLVGSLNAACIGNWLAYAKQLEEAGCDALELNLYVVETDPGRMSGDIECKSAEIVADVVAEVAIPVSVKISPWYTNVGSFLNMVVNAGAKGVVMFNRFYQPTIDPQTESLKTTLDLSHPEENRLPLRWTAILSGQIQADIATSTGIYSGEDVIKQILAGAKAAQTASAILKYGVGYVTRMNEEIGAWMDTKGYPTIESFRGKLSQQNIEDPRAFERIQYANILMGRKS